MINVFSQKSSSANCSEIGFQSPKCDFLLLYLTSEVDYLKIKAELFINRTLTLLYVFAKVVQSDIKGIWSTDSTDNCFPRQS